jgi:hypothetical protein
VTETVALVARVSQMAIVIVTATNSMSVAYVVEIVTLVQTKIVLSNFLLLLFLMK